MEPYGQGCTESSDEGVRKRADGEVRHYAVNEVQRPGYGQCRAGHDVDQCEEAQGVPRDGCAPPKSPADAHPGHDRRTQPDEDVEVPALVGHQLGNQAKLPQRVQSQLHANTEDLSSYPKPDWQGNRNRPAARRANGKQRNERDHRDHDVEHAGRFQYRIADHLQRAGGAYVDEPDAQASEDDVPGRCAQVAAHREREADPVGPQAADQPQRIACVPPRQVRDV